jgi:hypothetical protein
MRCSQAAGMYWIGTGTFSASDFVSRKYSSGLIFRLHFEHTPQTTLIKRNNRRLYQPLTPR